MTTIEAFNSFSFEGMANRPSIQWRPWRPPSPSVAVFPGELATVDVFLHEKRRDELKLLTRRFAKDGLSWTAGNSFVISSPTEHAAQLFLSTLPSGKALPKISPDGEGGLLMVWERDGDPLLITVDDLRLHAVIGATTGHAEYMNDIPFDRPEIPQAILDAIPAR